MEATEKSTEWIVKDLVNRVYWFWVVNRGDEKGGLFLKGHCSTNIEAEEGKSVTRV